MIEGAFQKDIQGTGVPAARNFFHESRAREDVQEKAEDYEDRGKGRRRKRRVVGALFSKRSKGEADSLTLEETGIRTWNPRHSPVDSLVSFNLVTQLQRRPMGSVPSGSRHE